MKPARIILLLVALVAGGLAAFLVLRGSNRPPDQVVTEVVREEETAKVLVARIALGTGERLTPETVEWQNWPMGSVRPEFVTIAATPDAPTELAGALVRFEFFPGEPIREQKLVHSDQGYLSAVLAQGMRGVSVGVDAVSSAGGFIVPNDRVDVLLTRRTDMGDVSDLILSNVRVMAIGRRLGEVGASAGAADTATSSEGPQAQVFDDSTIATLELTPGQADTLINSTSRGQLSLVLRSIVDFNDNSVDKSGSNQAVRVIRAGKEQSVMTGVSGQQVAQQQVSAQVFDPAAYRPATSVDPQIALPIEPQVVAQ
jgi:pilus assembly protein CpaB